MHILDRIVIEKKKEIAQRKAETPLQELEQKSTYQRSCHSLAAALRNDAPGVIAEFKRSSPSEKVINEKASLASVVRGYEAAGAKGLSVLTDTPFFGGSLNDLEEARVTTNLPILRKDFMLDPYQVVEAKAWGADVILLIAAILTPEAIRKLTGLAHELGMEVLLEVHDRREFKTSWHESIDLLGVNNRNLKSFEVSLQTSIELLEEVSPDRNFVMISESGLKHPEDVIRLNRAGYSGFLIGTHFMKHEDPAKAATELIQNILDEN